MKSAAVTQLEALLGTRRLDHTLIKPWQDDAPRRSVTTGIAALDEVMTGGWSWGDVSEIVGPVSSGRTRLATSALAATTAGGQLAALVDVTDRFDARLAADAGADLTRLLWVRGPSLSPGSAAGLFDRAVRQAVRACDLIVRAGGFSLVVLDLADVPPTVLRLLPHPTWMRLARSIEGHPTACVLVSSLPLGRSARGITVQVSASSTWRGDSLQSRHLQGLGITARFQTARAIVHAVDLTPSDPRTLAPSHRRTEPAPRDPGPRTPGPNPHPSPRPLSS